MNDFLQFTMPANLGPADQLAWIVILLLKLAACGLGLVVAYFLCWLALGLLCGLYELIFGKWSED